MVTIVNVVGTGNLKVELDIVAVQADLDVPFTEYNPSNYHGLYIRLEEKGPLITLFRSGKYNISGCSAIEELDETNDGFLKSLADLKIVESSVDSAFSVQNVVCIGDLHQQVDLNTLVVTLGLEVTEYEPEQFPGLVYRTKEIPAVMLVFSSGKTIITGTPDVEIAEQAFEHLRSEVSDIY